MRIARSIGVSCALLASFVVPASADQAICLSSRDAAKAVVALDGAKQVRHYCAPCGDATWREESVSNIEIVKTECGTEVEINGKSVDLAYVYIKKKGAWVNLANVVGVKVSDVPKKLSDKKTKKSE